MDELRARPRQVEQDAAAVRILAGGADRDVGELGREFREFRDQNNRMLNAMREDLTDLRDETRRGFLEMRGLLDATATGQQQIVAILSSMTEHGDDRPSP